MRCQTAKEEQKNGTVKSETASNGVKAENASNGVISVKNSSKRIKSGDDIANGAITPATEAVRNGKPAEKID